MQATVDLVLEGGYAAATIPRIAERADVSPRTVSTWFPAKDDILFDRVDDAIARATEQLGTGPGDVVDRIQAWLAGEGGRITPTPRSLGCATSRSPTTRSCAPGRTGTSTQLQSEIAAAVARDLGVTGRRRTAGLRRRRDGAAVRAPGDRARRAPATPPLQLERGFAFLRAGLAALRTPGSRVTRRG